MKKIIRWKAKITIYLRCYTQIFDTRLHHFYNIVIVGRYYDLGYPCFLFWQIKCHDMSYVYSGQMVRKCSSVSTSFCVQWVHSLSSLGMQVRLCRPFSIARLCSLSLYLVKIFLCFGSVTVLRYSATVYSLFRAR